MIPIIFIQTPKVYDGTPTELRTPASGYVNPAPITTKSNKISILFKSDGSNMRFDDNSFQGKWQATFFVRHSKSSKF